MTSTDIKNTAIAEMSAIAKIYAQFKTHGIIYCPFDSDLEGEAARKRLLLELRQNTAANSIKTRDIELLRSLRENVSKRLQGSKLAIFGTHLEKMKNRVLRDMDLKKHKQIVVRQVALTLREIVEKSPVEYRAISTNKAMVGLLTNLALYFSGNPLSELDMHKGLYLYGASQKGKTTIFKALQSVFNGTIMQFEVADCTELMNAASVGRCDIVDVIEKFVCGNVLLDDIGNTDPYITIKGSNMNVIAAIYRERLSRAEKSGAKTFFTSNFDLENLENRQNKFGNFFFSKSEIERIKLYCNIIAMPTN